jgi:hypothetical protein
MMKVTYLVAILAKRHRKNHLEDKGQHGAQATMTQLALDVVSR